MGYLMELPKCPAHDTQMEVRPLNRQTKEQKWCGTWYDCTEPGCNCSILLTSPELDKLHQQQKQNIEKNKREELIEQKDKSSWKLCKKINPLCNIYL